MYEISNNRDIAKCQKFSRDDDDGDAKGDDSASTAIPRRYLRKQPHPYSPTIL